MTAPREPLPLRSGDALFLDFDGTLVELAPQPDQVRVGPGLLDTLRGLQDVLHGALAVITGRRFADVQGYLQPLVLPGSGQHGAELIVPGIPPQAVPRSPQLHRALRELRARFDGVPGVLIEDKGLSVSLHYRNAPGREADCVNAMQSLAARLGLGTMRGKQVIEARTSPATKGDGIRALMELPDFRGRHPVFVGDDITDEYGFKAVHTLGGVGIKVGDGDSCARYRLADVAAVYAWLERSLRSLRGEPQ